MTPIQPLDRFRNLKICSFTNYSASINPMKNLSIKMNFMNSQIFSAFQMPQGTLCPNFAAGKMFHHFLPLTDPDILCNSTSQDLSNK